LVAGRNEEVFEGIRTLIVEQLELGSQIRCDKTSMQDLITGKDPKTCATAKRLIKDAAAVVVIKDKDEVVAAVEGNNKFSGLVGVDLACGRVDECSKAMIGACIGRVAGWPGVVIVIGRCECGHDGGAGRWLRRALVSPSFVQMAFDHGDQSGRILG
jgi:hypothetical protein